MAQCQRQTVSRPGASPAGPPTKRVLTTRYIPSINTFVNWMLFDPDSYRWAGHHQDHLY